MSLTVEIGPEVEAALARQAEACGLGVPAYAAAILEQAAGAAHLTLGRKPFDAVEFGRALDRMAQFSHKIPLLPDEAFSRQSFYEDHN